MEEKPHRLFPSVRLLMFVLVLVGCTLLSGGFAAFNFALVCMVNDTAVASGEQSPRSESRCGKVLNGSEEEVLTSKGYNGEFVWDSSTQASLLAAHSFGAIALNVPSGLLSDRYGSKLLFGLCILISGVADALTPTAAYAGFYWLFAVRILEGLGAGMAWPPILSMVSTWGTSAETGMLIALGATGYQMGPLVAMATSGLICDSRLGWPFIFYLWAVVCGLFVLVWCILYSNSPKRCRLISQKELTYLLKHRMRKNSCTNQSLWDVPWKAIFSAPCVLSTYVCQFCATWAMFYIQEFMPTYSKEVLQFGVNGNGYTASLPPLALAIVRIIVCPMADRFTFGGRSKTFSVKLFSGLQAFAPALCFFAMAFLDCRYAALAVASFCVATAFLSLSVIGYLKGGVLVAAKYAGLIGSIGNVAAYIGGIIMPYATGAMVTHHSVVEWQRTLFLVAGVMLLSGIQYQIFGSAKEQPWANETKPIHKVFTIHRKAGIDTVPEPTLMEST